MRSLPLVLNSTSSASNYRVVNGLHRSKFSKFSNNHEHSTLGADLFNFEFDAITSGAWFVSSIENGDGSLLVLLSSVENGPASATTSVQMTLDMDMYGFSDASPSNFIVSQVFPANSNNTVSNSSAFPGNAVVVSTKLAPRSVQMFEIHKVTPSS